MWGASNVALGAGALTAAYGVVPAAEIFILSTPVMAVLVAGFAIGIDLRVRHRIRGDRRLPRRLAGSPARPALRKRTGE